MEYVASAFLAFYGRVLYPTYEHAPRISGLDAAYDQVAAGAGMWVLGSSIFIVAVLAIMLHLLRGSFRVTSSNGRQVPVYYKLYS